jgi:transcriptional regulator with XRE-family HTH domain
MFFDDLEQKAENMHNVISANIVKFRKNKGYSQLKLALDIGLSGNAFIARCENVNNKAHFNINHIVKIAIVLDVNVKEFFTKNTLLN